MKEAQHQPSTGTPQKLKIQEAPSIKKRQVGFEAQFLIMLPPFKHRVLPGSAYYVGYVAAPDREPPFLRRSNFLLYRENTSLNVLPVTAQFLKSGCTLYVLCVMGCPLGVQGCWEEHIVRQEHRVIPKRTWYIPCLRSMYVLVTHPTAGGAAEIF